jgi:Subtilase family
MRNCRRMRRAFPLIDQLDDRCLLSAYVQPLIGGYTPAEITAAYGLNAVTFKSSAGTPVNGDGAGETIALIEEFHDPNIRSDLSTFDSAYHLPNPSLTVVNLAGNQTNNTWALEESMDVEWAHAIAPGAKILVVEATPSNFETKELQNQLAAVDIARKTPGVVAISMSWGFAERSGELSYDRYFTTPAGHTGITFIASSGDYGFSWYPSASPNVLSVGGTSLSLSSSGSYQSETAWYWSGGAYSPDEPEPRYQSTVQMTGQRSTPDVSFDANPSTGVNIYETSPRSGHGSWRSYGGTSLGAPVWAGIIAVVDQGRALAGKGSLDGATQTIPSLYMLPKSDFKNVRPADEFFGTGGLSSLLSGLFGSDSNGATANIATGLGSPNGPSLIGDLVTSTITTQPFLTGKSGQSASGLTQSHITKPKKHTETGSTHRKMLQNDRHIRRQRVRSPSVAGQRISAPGARGEE